MAMPSVACLPPMSSTEAIGVDLGGTKMLLGVLDADSEVKFESREASTGQTEEQLVELLVREIEEARRARPGVAAVGLGIPATIDHDRGFAISAVNLPIDNLPIRDAGRRAAPGCRSSSTTTPTSRPSPSTSTAPPAAPTTP